MKDIERYLINKTKRPSDNRTYNWMSYMVQVTVLFHIQLNCKPLHNLKKHNKPRVFFCFFLTSSFGTHWCTLEILKNVSRRRFRGFKVLNLLSCWNLRVSSYRMFHSDLDSLKDSWWQTARVRYWLNKRKGRQSLGETLLETEFFTFINWFLLSFPPFVLLVDKSFYIKKMNRPVMCNCCINTLTCVGTYVSKCCQYAPLRLPVMKQWLWTSFHSILDVQQAL